MIKFIIKRLLIIIPTLLGVLLIIFTITYLIPGDPAQLSLGSKYTEEDYLQRREELGLDKPFAERFFLYIKDVVTELDLGTSFNTKRPVSTMIGERIGTTIMLGLLSSAIAIVIGVGIGILSAVKQYSPIDYAATTFSVIFSAAPGFWVALLAIAVFALRLGWPAGGLDTWKHYILPVSCLALSPISLITRMTRTSMLDVIRQDYIRTARAKGVSERNVIFNHSLKNAMIPVLTVIGAQLTVVVGGSFIIESIFSIPGIGKLLINAIDNRDYPVIQGTVLVLSLCVCVINLIVDIAYAYVDPRIKSQYMRTNRKREKKTEMEGA